MDMLHTMPIWLSISMMDGWVTLFLQKIMILITSRLMLVLKRIWYYPKIIKIAIMPLVHPLSEVV